MKILKMTCAALALLMVMSFVSSANAAVRVYVRIAPPAPRVLVVKPRPQCRGAVWADGHWGWNGRRHVWVAGRYLNPRRGYVYVPGRWDRDRRGWFWVEGYWRRG